MRNPCKAFSGWTDGEFRTFYGFYEIYSDVRYAGRQTGDFPDDAVVLPGCLETEKSLVI